VTVAVAQKTICQITYKTRAGTLKFYSLQVCGSRGGNEQPYKSYFSPSCTLAFPAPNIAHGLCHSFPSPSLRLFRVSCSH